MSAEPTYQMEPELRLVARRSARVKVQAWTELRTIALTGCVIALVIGWFAARDLQDLYALRERGVTQQAVVTGKRKVHGKSDSYYLSYSLQQHDAAVQDEDQIPKSLYEQKRVGDTLPITFLPGQPQTHRLGHVRDERVQERSISWALGLLCASGLFGLLVSAMWFEYCKELHLTREGVPAPALVITCVAPQPNTKTTQYSVTYQFEAQGGEQTQTGSVSAEVGKQIVEGQTVTALYDAADPRRACLYCALRYTEVE